MTTPARWPAAMRADTAAKYLDGSKTWFLTRVAPELPSVYLSPGVRVWFRADLDRWLDTRRPGAAPSAQANPWDDPPAAGAQP
jgi:hypothetical protein